MTQTTKVGILLGDAELGAALAAAGYLTPAQIRDEEDSALEDIVGVGSSGLAAVRAKWPVREQ